MSERELALIIMHFDGYIECYANRSIETLIRVMPYCETREGEILADELLRLTLPDRFQRMYSADRLRATGNVRKITPSQIAESMGLLKSSRELDAWAKKYAPGLEVVRWTA